MERPNFEPIFTKKSEFCEKSSKTPVKEFIPHQSTPLRELVARFERGQRLNVHSNFAAGSNFETLSPEEAMQRIKSESLETDDFPPTDVHDVVDVQQHYEALLVHKREFAEKMKNKRKQVQQAKQQMQAQQAQQTAPPAPPSA